jgi:hypothetical protein
MRYLSTTLSLLGTSAHCALSERKDSESAGTDPTLRPTGITVQVGFDAAGKLAVVVAVPQESESSAVMSALRTLQDHLAGWSAGRPPGWEAVATTAIIELRAGHLMETDAPLWGPSFRHPDGSDQAGIRNLGLDKESIVGASASALMSLVALVEAQDS